MLQPVLFKKNMAGGLRFRKLHLNKPQEFGPTRSNGDRTAQHYKTQFHIVLFSKVTKSVVTFVNNTFKAFSFYIIFI